VDYVPLPIYKTFLIEFLNIAGLGPIFGAVAGALWGPAAFLWIVFGNILGGAVHDYLSGMISVRMDGASLPNMVGKTLGKALQQFMLFFTVVLMILVGAVFMLGPAEILASIFHANIHVAGVSIPINTTFWAIVIFIYYFLATLLPIDKIIGRIYPIFGFLLFFMAISIFIAMIVDGYKVPEVWGNLYNHHYLGDKMPIFPLMFISIACGAVSGFHATQSPMMARCITNEKQGRFVFYGAMVMEGIVALIWAAIAMAFFGSIEYCKKINLFQDRR
jgi:carbon starvation protein CstA